MSARMPIHVRPFEPARDWAAAAELIATTHVHDGVDWLPSAELLEHDWTTIAGFEPARDVRVVDGPDGSLDALANTDWRERDGRFVSHVIEIWVRPERRRQGHGTAMLEWAEGHARELVRTGAAGRTDWPHTIGGHAITGVPGHAELAASHGYAIHHYGYDMLRSLAEPIEDRALPPGLEIRPVDPSQHRAIWDADVEAFQDHPEPAQRTEDDFRSWFTSPALDTSLFRVAWDGDEVAGSVLTSIIPEENERLGVRRGWLDHVSVRRPWRGRGLAGALITSTLRLLRDRGMEEAALGVNAENRTGALQLYEKLGFRQHREIVAYRKPLAP
ncbi:MAG TPA: GNAT family N-acetyltransferase [Candidatus Limnocylindrales bacterium]